MSSSSSFAVNSNRADMHEYVKRLRALRDLAISGRRRPVKSESLALTGSDSSSPFGGRVSKDERNRPVSRIAYAFSSAKTQFRALQAQGTEKDAKGPAHLTDSIYHTEDVNVLPSNDTPSRFTHPVPSQAVPFADSREIQNQGSGNRAIEKTKAQMLDVGRTSLMRDLQLAILLLNEAKSEIKRLHRALDELKESAIKKQRVYQQQLANVSDTVKNLKVLLVERDEENHRLRKENESLVARCRRYREERNAERKNGEDQLVAIRALESERDQMRDGLLQGIRSKRQLVSHCDGDIVKNFPAANVQALGTETEKGQDAMKAGQFGKIDFEPDRASTPHGPHPRRLRAISLSPLVASNIAKQAIRNEARCTIGVKPSNHGLHLDESIPGRGGSGLTHLVENGGAGSHHLGGVTDGVSSKHPPVHEPIADALGDKSNVQVKNGKGVKDVLKRVCKVFKKPLPLSQDGSVVGTTKVAQTQSGVTLEVARSSSHYCKIEPSKGKDQPEPIEEPIQDLCKDASPSRAPVSIGYRRSSKLSTRRPAASAGSGPGLLDKTSSGLQMSSSTVEQQQCDIVGENIEPQKQETTGIKNRVYKPPALKLVFPATVKQPRSVNRELTNREIRQRQRHDWPQPSKKPDVFDAHH